VRQRLLGRIRDAARFRIVLFIAGAGYGKSEAIAQYWARLRKPKVFFRVPKGTDSLPAFLQAFSESCAGVAPGMSASVVPASSASKVLEDPARALASWAATHLRHLRGTIAIDDFENASTPTSTEISAFIEHLVEDLPYTRWFIATRFAGSLPVANWIAQKLADLPINADDLCFTVDEAVDLGRLVGSLWDYDQIKASVMNLSGWPFPLALELRSSSKLNKVLGNPDRSLTFQFLASQVWGALSIEERAFLELAAVVPKLTTRRGIEGGFDQTVQVARSLAARLSFASFVNDVFTMHDLFRTFVLEQVRLRGHSSYAELLMKGARVLVGDGDLGEALELVIQLRDSRQILAFIDRREIALMNIRHRSVVRRLLTLLRDNESESAAFLSMICAYDDGEMAAAIRLGRRLLSSPDLRPELIKPVFSVVARSLIVLGSDGMAEELSWQTFGDRQSDMGVPVLRDAILAWSAASRGGWTEAQRLVDQVSAKLGLLEPADRALVLHALTGTSIWLGHYGDALHFAEDALTAAVDCGDEALGARCATNIVVALVNREFSLDGLEDAIDRARHLCERNGLWSILRHALECYGLLVAWSGLEDQTERVIAEIQRLPRSAASGNVGIGLNLLKGYLAVMRGDLGAACSILARVATELSRRDDVSARSGIYQRESLLLLTFAAAMRDDRQVATQAWERYQELKSPGRRGLGTRHREVIALFALGRFTHAGRIARAVAGEDEATIPLDRWHLLIHKDRTSLTVRNEVQAYRNAAGIGLLAQVTERLMARWVTKPNGLTKLTPSELAILEMVSLDLNNKEIAVARSSTEATVKVHVGAIFRKLGADSRRSAVTIAREHGVIS